MTRLEFDAILKENLKDIHFKRPDQTYEAVLGCMVAAYNRALEDVLELYYNPTPEEDQDTFDKDLESLRVV